MNKFRNLLKESASNFRKKVIKIVVIKIDAVLDFKNKQKEWQ